MEQSSDEDRRAPSLSVSQIIAPKRSKKIYSSKAAQQRTRAIFGGEAVIGQERMTRVTNEDVVRMGGKKQELVAVLCR